MPRGVIIAIGVVAIVAAVAFVFPKLAQTYARQKVLDRCADLEAQLSAIRVQGGDAVTAARLENELRTCQKTANEYGATLDLGGLTLDQCDSYGEQIAQEWAHYRSTEYSDAVKRNNTRNTMLRLGQESVRCYQKALAETELLPTAERLKQSILRAIGASQERERCFKQDMSGCGRFGLNEPHGNDKARDERERISLPLIALLPEVETKIAAIKATQASRVSSISAMTSRTFSIPL